MSIETGNSGFNSFSESSVEWCRANRVELFQLSGQSLSSLKEAGKLFWDRIPEEIQEVKSVQTVVGIDLDHISLKGTNWPLTGVQSQILFANYKTSVEQLSKDLTVIKGNIADYAEAAFRFYESTGMKLFDGKYAKTTTSETSGMFKNRIYEIGDDTPENIVNDFSHPKREEYGLRIKSWFTNGRGTYTFVFPLLVSKTAVNMGLIT